MNNMIQRFFHPVVQGAYYSERHRSGDINIVYDCGTSFGGVKRMSKVVSQSFCKEDTIHALFISHFDYDHVSLIDELRATVGKIERVVIPKLQKNEKVLLAIIYKSLNNARLETLVTDPQTFFGNETQIIEVEVGEEEGIGEYVPIDLLNSGSDLNEIPSGTPLAVGKHLEWVYIPYNHVYKNRHDDFIEQLDNHKIDVEELRNDPECLLEGTVPSVDGKGTTKVKNVVKNIYKRLPGGINENSMFLYSGPILNAPHGQRLYLDYWHPHFCYDRRYCLFHHDVRVACLYTGDGNLKKVNIRTIYKPYWDLIGTIQIPHHGSLDSFNSSSLRPRPFLCPISVGENNSYGHPSAKVISEINNYYSYPILVTDEVSSLFVEIIY